MVFGPPRPRKRLNGSWWRVVCLAAMGIGLLVGLNLLFVLDSSMIYASNDDQSRLLQAPACHAHTPPCVAIPCGNAAMDALCRSPSEFAVLSSDGGVMASAEDLALCDESEASESLQAAVKAASIHVVEAAGVSLPSLSVVVLVDKCVGEQRNFAAMLRNTFESLVDADYSVMQPSRVDLYISVDSRARPACESYASGVDWSARGTKTIIRWKCHASQRHQWLRSLYFVDQTQPSAVLLLHEGASVSKFYTSWVKLAIEERWTNLRAHIMGALLRQSVPRTNLVYEPLGLANKYAQVALARPVPGILDELLVFSDIWTQFHTFVRTEIERLSSTTAAQSKWQRYFLPWLALFCQEHGFYFLAPHLTRGQQFAADSRLYESMAALAQSFDFDENFAGPFVPVAPCHYEWDGRPKPEFQSALEISNANQVVGVAAVNDAFSAFAMSWLCQTASLSTTHAHTVFVALDDQAYKKLANNPFHVPVVNATSQMRGLEGSLTFGTFGYAELIIERLNWNAELVNCGADVLVFEVDALWLDNAYQLVRNLKDVDLRMYVNMKYQRAGRVETEFGGGFMYMHHSRPTAEFLSDVVKRYRAHMAEYAKTRRVTPTTHATLNGMNDQHIMSKLLSEEAASFHLKFDSFSSEQVLNGSWYQTHSLKDRFKFGKQAVVINNNFLRGNNAKYERANAFGHWFLPDNVTLTCDHDKMLQFHQALIVRLL